MAASPDALADEVRQKREAVDSDIERLRAGLQRADPRRLPPEWWARRVGPVVVGLFVLAAWRVRRHLARRRTRAS